jgi:hypothetical protein
MKKLSFLMAILPLLFCACSSFNEENSTPIITTTPDLQAGFADDTRTYVENNKYLRWHEDDRLTAFYGNTLNRQYKFNGKTGANSGTFSLVPSGELGTGNAFDRIYAVYPYNETVTITEEGEISLTLPAVQSYAENSFGKGANTMIAVTENLEDTFLAFKNACGYLKLKLYGDNVTIANIEIKGNNGEKIAGAATATITFGGAPQLTMADEATTSVTIDCGEGITLGTTAETATEFWVVLPETTFTKGLTIKATSTNGGVFEKSTANEVVITRNEIMPMVAVAVEFAAGPANNEIWYTNGSTTKSTTPYATDVFGANITSNTYDAEKECWIIKFDGNVTSIGFRAFWSCTSLTSITIPNSVTSSGYEAFCNCTSLTSITIPNSITEIGERTFCNCDSITTITIPDSVTEIGECTFYECTSLTNVTIPDSVTSIGVLAFGGCYSLISVAIPDSVISIGSSAFNGCKSLTSVAIPDSVTSIGSLAFGNCSNLTSVTISNSLTEIGDLLFKNCVLLKDITIPNSITSIGKEAFFHCRRLTSVIIPDSVTFIGESAFEECTSLKEVYCKPITPPATGSHIFYDNADGRIIYVPMESVAAYKAYSASSIWSSYNIEGYDF